MKKIGIILFNLFILVFVGCANKSVDDNHYVYKGENEFWIAQYKVSGAVECNKKDGKLSANSKAERTLTVTYKKDLSELSSIKHLEISYESSAAGSKFSQDFDKNPPLEKTYVLNSGGSNTAMENADESVKVNINIDGKIQTIDLKK